MMVPIPVPHPTHPTQPRSVAVIGAGVTGLATTAALLERGVQVACFDRGAPLGERSAGESRIFRYAHRDPVLVEAAVRARALFSEWAEGLIEPVGTVISGGGAQEWTTAMAAAGVEYIENPGLRLPTSRRQEPAVLDPAGGVIRVDRVGELLVKRSQAALRSAYVYALEEKPDGVVVHAGGVSERFDAVVLAAGSGNAPLAAQVGLYPPADLAHHARFTFRLRETAPPSPQCWITTSSAEMHTYQHSGAPGQWAVGVELGPEDTRWEVGREAAVAAAEAATVTYVKNELDLVDPEIVSSLYCTTNPTLDDGIHYRRQGRVLCVYGENLFKFAPLIGRDCADAVLNESVPDSLGPAT